MSYRATAQKKREEAEEARQSMLDLTHDDGSPVIRPGATVYTILRHVSRSGMTRHIDVYAMSDGEPVYLSGYAAKVLDYRRTSDGALIVGGAGMDMGFHVVCSLSHALYPDGFPCAAPDDPAPYRGGCPSNDHLNYRNGDAPTFHKEGGYALSHRWL